MSQKKKVQVPDEVIELAIECIELQSRIHQADVSRALAAEQMNTLHIERNHLADEFKSKHYELGEALKKAGGAT